MQNVIDKLELMFAGMGAFLGWFFGGFDGFFYALVVFVTCDYFTGVLQRPCDMSCLLRSGLRVSPRRYASSSLLVSPV